MVSTERGGWMTGAPIINEREPGFLIIGVERMPRNDGGN